MRWFATPRKKTKGDKGEAIPADSEFLPLVKVDNKKATQALASENLTITMDGVRAFKLYGNLLSDKTQPAWVKTIGPE